MYLLIGKKTISTKKLIGIRIWYRSEVETKTEPFLNGGGGGGLKLLLQSSEGCQALKYCGSEKNLGGISTLEAKGTVAICQFW